MKRFPKASLLWLNLWFGQVRRPKTKTTKMPHSENIWPLKGAISYSEMLDKHAPEHKREFYPAVNKHFILWMPPFQTTKGLSAFEASLSSDVAEAWVKTNTECHVAAPKAFSPLWSLYHTRRKPDRRPECNFVRLVWCCISYTLEQLRFKKKKEPLPIHHSLRASTVKHEHVQEEGVCSGVVRGPACQVMDIWGTMQSCGDERRLSGQLGGNFTFGSSSVRVLVSVLLLVEPATLFFRDIKVLSQ